MPEPAATAPHAPVALDQGTYEILRARLAAHGADLRARLEKLNAARKAVFGALPTTLLATERITTAHNCTPRDMIPIGDGRFLLGYNVLLGLRTETQPADVFALYQHENHQFRELPLGLLADPQFEADFKALYRYYKNASFAKFSQIGPHLFMKFRIGAGVTDIKTFKWLSDGQRWSYLGNRFDHEFHYPPQHGFEWTRTHRELHRHGLHPHISIEDRVFVECLGGDLTIKVEDNTTSGAGIYSEPVEQHDQTLDDAEVYYSIVGHLIVLKVRPYQEKTFRYLVFNEKVKEVRRIDSIEDSCVLLPDDHGLIFARGYYLQSGEFKLFETALEDMHFNKRIAAPNGEDFLYTFYQRDSGDYVLLSYNLIARTVETPIICSGFSLFENGEMALFRADREPQKHHVIQIWQTPYVGADWQPPVQSTDYLCKLGNPVLVGAMAECQAVLGLLGKEDTFSGLHLDLVKATTDLLDAYFWLDRAEAFDLRAPLVAIREAAAAALSEFEKVVAIRKSTAAEVSRITGRAQAILDALPTQKFGAIGEFVARLAELRAVRGELISLKELRHADLPLIGTTERHVGEAGGQIAERTVAFLLQPEALTPFRARAEELGAKVPALPKVTEAKQLDDEIAAAGKELDLLIETVSTLKIQDATETTRIIEAVSEIYAVLNQARAALKQKIRALRGTEAVAEFASQTRLLDQALTNYLDLCTAPEKCDEYLNRVMVQVEELEARFADFDEFVVQLGEKRSALSGAFEARKIELVETRNRKASALLTAAERILKGIKHRADHAAGLDELNSYFAADAMVEKVRDLTRQLTELGDTVKADDLASRLKALREDSARQLKDRQDLFAGGPNVIQLGRHRFLTNSQELDLTIIPRGDAMCMHLTGTNFFEPITDEAFLATRAVWPLEVVSETPAIYRAEYLAFKLLRALEADGRLGAAARWTDEERLAQVREFMTPRYSEGYVKGVHDTDAAKILAVLVELHTSLDLLRFPSSARALAALVWRQFPDGEAKALLSAKVRGYATMQRAFPSHRRHESHVAELRALVAEFASRTALFSGETIVSEAAEYLSHQLEREGEFVVSPEAAALFTGFEQHLREHHFTDALRAARKAVEADLPATFDLLREWVRGYALAHTDAAQHEYIDETACLLLRDARRSAATVEASSAREITPLKGSHPGIRDGTLRLNYIEFTQRLRAHEAGVVPAFGRFQAMKMQIVGQARARLRLEGFKPKVLGSFVRNQLIDTVYLPLVGDNLAKQIGAAGDTKRTDRMGLLLLVSPPGYGKTTLMEYVASRLGIVFMKVNGPAIGHRVTSLDPAEAPNAAAREEIEKLNLAFEMGDNVMVCLDDIQHLNAEFLQKFISLCDGSRKIEGVHRGQPRTYDLRGKKVAVVMAGNPYTESGEKFRIPDMLANRADTYNLGDVIGGHADAFRASYVENAATSNTTLARVAARHPRDILAALELAATGPREGLDFEGAYAPAEFEEIIGVMKRMLRVRDVVLRVNEEYIRSAAQADAYRTEPPFKLQGSYRNMNRLAEKLSLVMNDAELEALLLDHYRNEAQTLTSGAESNLLKLKELLGTQTPAEAVRWEEIRKTFRKNKVLGGDGGENDPISRVVQKLGAFYEGLDGIKEAIAAAMKADAKDPVTIIIAPPQSTAQPDAVPDGATVGDWTREVKISRETLKEIWSVIDRDRAREPQE
jgi:hypothetical protein